MTLVASLRVADVDPRRLVEGGRWVTWRASRPGRVTLVDALSAYLRSRLV